MKSARMLNNHETSTAMMNVFIMVSEVYVENPKQADDEFDAALEMIMLIS